ncbi:MAG: TetR/AcrR family transcriptional regulator [Acidobacteriota bacterium]|nr:TetR/AcrR family transcriptional regulator [Acidobacteriota bacterium]
MTPAGADFVPARPTLRTLRRDRTRDEIARAALELITRKGYGDTLVEEIAARALISPRTFYRYFPAKEDAFFHGLPAFESALLDFPADDPKSLREALAGAGAAFCAAVAEQKDAILPRLPHALAEPALLGQLTHRLYAAEVRLARRLEARLAAGAGSAWNAEVLAAALTASLIAALRRWQRSPRRTDLAALVEQALTTLAPAIAKLESSSN